MGISNYIDTAEYLADLAQSDLLHRLGSRRPGSTTRGRGEVG
jgi:hypothetical protein